MGRVQTSVMIDEDKRQLAKQRGIKLQDLLDEALNRVLELEVQGKAELEIEKESILKEIELKEKQKEEYLEKCDKQISLIEKEKQEYLAKYNNMINELDIKLKMNAQALENVSEEQKELQQKRDYEEIIAKALEKAIFTEELEQEFEEYCIKYGISPITPALEEAKRDMTRRYYND